jgi:hypothetical protein
MFKSSRLKVHQSTKFFNRKTNLFDTLYNDKVVSVLAAVRADKAGKFANPETGNPSPKNPDKYNYKQVFRYYS